MPWLVQRFSKHARWAWVGIASTKREVSAAGGIGSAGFFGLTVARLFGVDVRWTVKISIGALLVAFEALRSTG